MSRCITRYAVLAVPLLAVLSCSNSGDPAPSPPLAVGPSGSTTRECDDAAWIAHRSNTTEWFWGVWGSDDDDMWVVGGGGATLRYNGRCWLPQPSATAPGAAAAAGVLCDVWMDVSHQGYAVGTGGLILWFDGDQWLSQPGGTTENLFGVWGTGPGNVIAVGTNGTILQNDGSGWAPMQSPTGLSLFGIWGSGPADVYAVGARGVILHYDGSFWSFAGPGAAQNFSDIYGTADNDVYAVGDAGQLYHYNGTAWSAQDAGTIYNLFGVWGYDRNVFVVGAAGTILRKTDDGAAPGPTAAASLNGWVKMDSGTTDDLFNCWGISECYVVAVGGSGTILLYSAQKSDKCDG